MQHRNMQLDDERFYVVIFAAQRVPNWPRFAHTFATFVKASPSADPAGAAGACRLESHTISWLPRTLDIRLWRRRPEPGINLDLRTTLLWVRDARARISRWGPFQIDRKLFDRAMRQEQRLATGALGYKALDSWFRPQKAFNCIHAVSDIDRDDGLLRTGTRRGEGASALVARHFQRWIIDPATSHDWVARRLGLEHFPIFRRSFPQTLQMKLHGRLLLSAAHSLLGTLGSLGRQTLLLRAAVRRCFFGSRKEGQAAAVPVMTGPGI
jgi:hypothetical protein